MLKVYGLALSSPTNKVRFTANYLNIPFEFHHVNLAAGEQRTPEFLAVNPLGRIPCIDDNGFRLAESNAIIRYLADKHQSALYPKELQQRALVDQWMDFAVQHVAIPLSKIMYNMYFYKLMNAAKDERSLQDGHKFLELNLPVIEKQLSQSAYLASAEITLADIVLLASLDMSEAAKVDFSIYPHIAQWRKKLQAQSFYQACFSNYTEAFKEAMARINVAVA